MLTLVLPNISSVGPNIFTILTYLFSVRSDISSILLNFRFVLRCVLKIPSFYVLLHIRTIFFDIHLILADIALISTNICEKKRSQIWDAA